MGPRQTVQTQIRAIERGVRSESTLFAQEVLLKMNKNDRVHQASLKLEMDSSNQ